jgi:hypothetical protein
MRTQVLIALLFVIAIYCSATVSYDKGVRAGIESADAKWSSVLEEKGSYQLGLKVGRVMGVYDSTGAMATCLAHTTDYHDVIAYGRLSKCADTVLGLSR